MKKSFYKCPILASQNFSWEEQTELDDTGIVSLHPTHLCYVSNNIHPSSELVNPYHLVYTMTAVNILTYILFLSLMA